MRRLTIVLVTVVAIAAVTALTAGSAAAKPRGFNGKIVTNSDNLSTGTEQVYTVDPDGTDEHLVADNSEVGQWSPEGTRITLFGELGELLFNVDDGSSVSLGLPGDLYPDLLLFCGAWSPNGARLACEGFGKTDPSLNGVYTLRSSDGGDLQRVTSDPNGDDAPSDYSPNGDRLVITRANETTYALYTVKVDGSGFKQITPDGMDFNFGNGSWSPQGNQIVFSAHVPNGDFTAPCGSCTSTAQDYASSRSRDHAAARSPIRRPSGASIPSGPRTGGRSPSGATRMTASGTSTPSTPTGAASSR